MKQQVYCQNRPCITKPLSPLPGRHSSIIFPQPRFQPPGPIYRISKLTARYEQNDRFWFTFYHEAGHILLHGKKYISLENIDFPDAESDKEKEADEFFESWTFSQQQEEEVLASAPLTEEDIVTFAKKFQYPSRYDYRPLSS